MRKAPKYARWLDFIKLTESSSLQASMMELYLFSNKHSLRAGMTELARFFFYALRGAVSPRLNIEHRYSLVFAVDTPGVGGVETLLPLLKAKPDGAFILVAATNFICNDVRLQRELSANQSIHLVNVDRIRPKWQAGGAFLRHLLRLVTQLPSVTLAIPSFAYRYLGYFNLSRRLLGCSARPRLVIFNERMLLSAAFADGARSVAAQTIAVQHGNFVENYEPVNVDFYLTWGKVHSAWLKSRATTQTRAIGCPRLDHMTSQRSGTWQLPGDRPLRLIFFSQVGAASVPPEWISSIRRMVLELAATHLFSVVVKLHPLDTIESWQNEGLDLERVNFLGGQLSLDEALADADLMSSFYSSVLAEGLLYDLPIIQLNSYPSSVPRFPDENGIPCVRDASEFCGLVESWRSLPSLLETVRVRMLELREDYFFGLGSASQRFWTTLEAL